MRVRMLVEVSGTRDGERWPTKGGLLDVPASEASDLCAAGLAEMAPVEHVERAVAAVPEKRGPGRPRKASREG